MDEAAVHLVGHNSQLFTITLSIYDCRVSLPGILKVAIEEGKMEKEFANKTLLVTGATSGIGKATALRFAEAGANVAAIGRNETALEKLKQEIGALGSECLSIARRSVPGGRD